MPRKLIRAGRRAHQEAGADLTRAARATFRCLAAFRQLRLGFHSVNFWQGRRHLWLALAASALMHMVLLAPWAMLPRVRLTVATQALQARIHATGQQLPPSTALAETPAGLQGPTGSLSARPSRHDAGLGDSRSGPPNTPSGAQRRSRLAAAGEALTMPTVAPTDPDGVGADELRQYRMALAIAARRFRHYPPVAREGSWEGRVDVELSASAGLGVPRVSLVRSSGHRALDEQALSMVEQAAAVTRLPDGLQGIELRVLLPIEFSLETAR